MVALLAKSFPLRQIVRALLFDIGLGIASMLAMEFLRDWVLDLDRLDLFIKCR